MSFDLDRAIYIESAAMASAAAFVIPYARPLAVMIGLMISNPDEMKRAAAQWNDKSPVDIGPPPALFVKGANEPHPPMVAPNDSGGDIGYLRGELGRLARAVGNNKEWVGASYDAFMSKFEEFDGQLALLENRRKGVGDSLDLAAEFYHWGAMVCQAIAAALAGLVAYVSIARATAMFAVAGESSAIAIVSSMTASMRAILNAQMKGIWKVTAVIAGVTIYYNQQSQKLPGMKAMTGETPEFTQALNYDTASGGLAPVLPKLDTDIKQPSPFPDFGW